MTINNKMTILLQLSLNNCPAISSTIPLVLIIIIAQNYNTLLIDNAHIFVVSHLLLDKEYKLYLY